MLDLYGITDPSDRQRILGSAASSEEEEAEESGDKDEADSESD